jgi:opacity protein-like surface antigen
MKRVILLAVLLLMAAAPAMAGTAIMADVIFGVTADYDAESGTLVWDNGTSATIVTGSGTHFFNASFDATFDGANDTSSGGDASAIFDPGANWSVMFSWLGIDVLGFSGHTSSTYNEGETSEGDLYGGVIAEVTSMTLFNTTYFGGETPFWQGGNTIGIKASTLMLEGIDDYGADWSSQNVTITMVADETTIPEPATMMLLGLGGLLLRKRKNA